MQAITSQQANAAFDLMIIAYKLIAAAGSVGKPSGHLYAEMMNVFDSVDGYESMIGLMVRSKLISKRGDLLVASRL